MSVYDELIATFNAKDLNGFTTLLREYGECVPAICEQLREAIKDDKDFTMVLNGLIAAQSVVPLFTAGEYAKLKEFVSHVPCLIKTPDWTRPLLNVSKFEHRPWTLIDSVNAMDDSEAKTELIAAFSEALDKLITKEKFSVACHDYAEYSKTMPWVQKIFKRKVKAWISHATVATFTELDPIFINLKLAKIDWHVPYLHKHPTLGPKLRSMLNMPRSQALYLWEKGCDLEFYRDWRVFYGPHISDTMRDSATRRKYQSWRQPAGPEKKFWFTMALAMGKFPHCP